MTGNQKAQAFLGMLGIMGAHLGYTAVSTGFLADLLGVSGADEDVQKRTRYEWLMDTLKANLDGAGVIGFGINAAINEMQGKGGFISIPLIKWVQEIAGINANYWTYEQKVQEKLDATINAMAKIKGYQAPFGKIVGENTEEKMEKLVQATESGNYEEAVEILGQNIEDRKAILEDIGYDLSEKEQGDAYRKELAKIEKDEESLKEFSSYSSALGALGNYFDKGGNFTETIDAVTGKSEAWKYMLNAKETAGDLWERDDAIFKYFFGEPYKIEEKKSEEEEEVIEEQKEAFRDEFRK
jgi:hypothetical protein